jgi:hypothetical protein
MTRNAPGTAIRTRAERIAALLKERPYSAAELQDALGEYARQYVSAALSYLRGTHCTMPAPRCIYIAEYLPPPSPTGKGPPVPRYCYGTQPDRQLPKLTIKERNARYRQKQAELARLAGHEKRPRGRPRRLPPGAANAEPHLAATATG